MAELVRMTRRGSRDVYFQQYYERNSERNKDKNASNASYQRQYYLENKDKKAGNNGSRDEYLRQYYQHNKDKKAEYLSRNQEWIEDSTKRLYLENSRGQYFQQYYQRNKDKNAEYLSRNQEWIEDLNRQSYLRKKLRRGEKGVDGTDNRHADSTKERKRRYYLENNESISDYRNRLGEAKSRYLGVYKTQNKEKVAEYFRSHSGYQRTFRSWKTPEIVRDFFDSIASRLNISKSEDWYRISRKQITLYGGESLYTTFGNLGAALQYAYPEINWDLDAFSHRGKKSGQRWLKLKIKELLPGTDIVEDYQHPDLNWVADSDHNMELDLWIPQHRIGIEYQGEQHYFNIDSLGPSSAAGAYSERDTLKNSLCESRGITLIAIPYWWDGSMESLSATLYQARPDVFPVSHGRPIPREMPVLASGKRVQHSESDQLKNIE